MKLKGKNMYIIMYIMKRKDGYFKIKNNSCIFADLLVTYVGSAVVLAW